MPLSTRKQIRESVIQTTETNATQVGSLVNDLINITLQEIADPAWAFRNERHHLWSWLKRKTSVSATAEDVVLPRDVDKISLVRQTDSPAVLSFIEDKDFYEQNPEPTETGDPTMYRIWEVDGVSTRLAVADTIDVVSSSASDTSEYSVAVTGYVGGKLETEVLTLNGTSSVTGTITFDAGIILISKSANTNGNITVNEHSGLTTVVVVGKEEVSPRFKVMSLYPIPTSTTLYVEYYKRIKELNNDTESPEFDPKWHHVVRLGTMAKVYEHLGKTADAERVNNWYSKMVRSMVASDTINPDYISRLKRRGKNLGVRLILDNYVA